MLFLSEVKQIPIMGVYNNEIVEISKKLAESYNNSIKDINARHFLGYNFKPIDEVRNCKSSYNIKERILEIHYSEYTTFVLPSAYAEFYHLNEYFNIDSKENFKIEMITEGRCKRKSLFETLTVKGDAGNIFSKVVDKGKKTAERFFKKDIEIKNADSILSLSNNINESLNKVLGNSIDNKKLVEYITSFIKDPTANNVQEIYNRIFEANATSKFAKSFEENIDKHFDKFRKKGELFGKTTKSELEKILSASYDVDVEEIRKAKAVQYKTVWDRIKDVFSLLTNSLEGAWNSVIALLTGKLSLSLFVDGVGKTVTSILAWSLSKLLGLIKKILHIEYDPELAKQVMKKKNIKADASLFDKLKAAKEAAFDKAEGLVELIKETLIGGWNSIIKFVLKAVDTSQEAILNGLGDITKYIEDIKYINYIKYAAATVAAYFFLKYTIRFLQNLFTIVSKKSIDNEKLSSRISFDKITGNFGFDKVILTEAMTYIICANIEAALKSEKFSQSEFKRLKLLHTSFLKLHKKECKEGIKFIIKNA